MSHPCIRDFASVSMADLALVGGKNASIGEMVRALTSQGIPIPGGFVITTDAFWQFLDHNDLHGYIYDNLRPLTDDDIDRVQAVAQDVQQRILAGRFPEELAHAISEAHTALVQQYGEHLSVAVRSSATAEDLPGASFAGQHETLLNVRGEQLINACREVYASLFTGRAIIYRIRNNFPHEHVGLSIGVQKMVRSDLACAGVAFTLDTESGFRDVVMVNAAPGLGESIVKGVVTPDEYTVFKTTLTGDHVPILRRVLGSKDQKLIYRDDADHAGGTVYVDTSKDERTRFSLDDDEILTVSRYAIAIERYYSEQAGHPVPMDVEWAKDGDGGEVFIVQARPETVMSRADTGRLTRHRLVETGTVLANGKAVGHGIVHGAAHQIPSLAEMGQLADGEVLVTDMTDPDWEPIMKRAGAIVTNRGGRTCHAAIVAREQGIPAIVGCGDATQTVPDGAAVTVSCTGDSGEVYDGTLAFDTETIKIDIEQRPRTRVMLNLSNPDRAFRDAFLPNDGVGLVRLEFVINNRIGVHPRAILEPERLTPQEQKDIAHRAAAYADAQAFYVSVLAEGVGQIAAAFYPKPVIVRLSDFKSNEYRSLLGGRHFEPVEENPMIGLRGASRYVDAAFQPAFALECQALLKVRERMGLDNVALLVPFVRSPQEGRAVLQLLAQHGLDQEALKVYLMCELPSNVLQIDEYLEAFDGISIGSNDLTQLTLGIDRDSSLVPGFSESNEAVLALMQQAIHAARERHKYAGICGQGPSDHPELARWLVEQGVSSVSLTRDTILPVTRIVLEAERDA